MKKKSFKVGQTVVWQPDGSKGVVVEVGYCAVKVRWEDGKWGLFPHTAGLKKSPKLLILDSKECKQ